MFSSLACSAFSNASTVLCAGAGLDERLGRAAPDHHQAIGAARLLELADVVAHLLGEFHLVLALLHVGAVELLDVVLVEDGLARLDGREERLHLLQQRAVEHTGLAGRRVHVVFEDVPTGEDQVIEPGEWNEVFDLRRAAFGAFAQADGAHLRQRPDGAGDSFAYRFHAGHEGCGNGTHAGDHDPQLSFGRRYLACAFFALVCRHQYQSVQNGVCKLLMISH